MNRFQLSVTVILFFAIVFFAVACNAQSMQWVRQAGSGGSGTSVGTDANGNVYVTGVINNPAMFEDDTFSAHYADVFIAKYDPNGNKLWAKTGGGNMIDQGNAIATDASGNSFVTGIFRTNTPNPTVDFSGTMLTSYGDYDFFIAMYNTNGDLQWIKQGGGSLGDNGFGIAVDNNGGVYACGAFQGTATFGTQTVTSVGQTDAFIAKYDYNGNLIWITTDGGTGSDHANAVKYESQLGLVTTGQFQNTALFGTASITAKGLYDVFVARYDLSGNNVWAKRAGGFSINGDEGKSIATDNDANIYVSGNFAGLADFGSLQITSGPDSGYADVFVAKYDAGGNPLWVRHGGGEFNDEARGIVADANGNVYVTGQVDDPFVTFDTITVPPFGNEAVFLAKYNTNGDILFVKRYAHGIGQGLTMLQNNCLAITGMAASPSTNSFDTISLTYFDQDAFVGKFCDVSIPTSVEESSAETIDLTLYPNPAFNQLNVALNSREPVEIVIYNSLLQEVAVTKAIGGNVVLDLNCLHKGVYQLRAMASGSIVTKSFVVMR